MIRLVLIACLILQECSLHYRCTFVFVQNRTELLTPNSSAILTNGNERNEVKAVTTKHSVEISWYSVRVCTELPYFLWAHSTQQPIYKLAILASWILSHSCCRLSVNDCCHKKVFSDVTEDLLHSPASTDDHNTSWYVTVLCQISKLLFCQRRSLFRPVTMSATRENTRETSVASLYFRVSFFCLFSNPQQFDFHNLFQISRIS